MPEIQHTINTNLFFQDSDVSLDSQTRHKHRPDQDVTLIQGIPMVQVEPQAPQSSASLKRRCLGVCISTASDASEHTEA